VGARGDEPPPGWTPIARAGALAAAVLVTIVAFVGLVGNVALTESGRAARAGDWRTSMSEARRARTWAPWSSEAWRLTGEAQLGLGDTIDARASFRRAIAKSPGDWSLWFDLARVTTGREQRAALTRAARLDPLSPEIAELRRELAAQGSIGVVRG
jgi:Flp pilus assembly protein TadD